MEILGRFDGRNGQITIAQERKTGARLYVEEGVKQRYVLPGGSAGLDYVRLMVQVLEGAQDVILFGCGGRCACVRAAQQGLSRDGGRRQSH
jgi:hypothetical protein